MLSSGFYEGFSPITTDRLLIRKLGIGDAEDIYAVSRNPAVSRFVLWETHRSIADSRSMLRGILRAYRAQEPATLGIVLRQTGHVVGTIGFLWIDREHNAAEIGYSLAEELWNQGLMTEALQAMLKFGFEALRRGGVGGGWDVRNTGSGRVMRKAGMQKEGVLRQRLYNKGEYIDVELWSILASDYEQKQ